MADQLKAVRLPINFNTEGARATDAVGLSLCANFATPHRVFDFNKLEALQKTDPKKAQAVLEEATGVARQCLDKVNTAVRNGTISDVPAMALALRSIAFTSPTGNDNVAETLDDIATQIDKNKASIGFDYYHPAYQNNLGALNRKPFTNAEIKSAAAGHYKDETGYDSSVALPEMRPNRTIPIDQSTAYIMTTADIVAHPERYFEMAKNGVACEMDANGKVDKKCAVDMKALAATVADVRTRYTADYDQKFAGACLLGNGHTKLEECQQVAMRNTAEMMLKGQVKPYNAELYSPATVAATQLPPVKPKTTAKR